MRKAQNDVLPEEIEAAVFSAYHSWVSDWPEFAHFIPAALRYMEQDTAFHISLRLEPEILFERLLVSARPELDSDFAPETAMPPRDRRAIFEAIAALLLCKAAAPDPDETFVCDLLTNMVAFLAQFDGPVQPVLEAWENHPESPARVRLCFVMAAAAQHRGLDAAFANRYLEGWFRPLPENEGAIAETFSPEHIARYLLDHTDDFEGLDEEEQEQINAGWQAAARAAGWGFVPHSPTPEYQPPAGNDAGNIR